MILRSRITQHPERSVPEHAPEILTQVMVAHAGFVEDERAVVIPLSYHYDANEPGILYLHGGVKSRAMDQIASG